MKFRVCDTNWGTGVSLTVIGNKVTVKGKYYRSRKTPTLEEILQKMVNEPKDVNPCDHGVGKIWWSEELPSGKVRARHITTSSVSW
jgi:hypothetical protein